jgi:DNA-binding transcriptional MerR regulator
MSDGRSALPSKLYFRIGEVAGIVGVEPHVLRYWEREFRSIRPTKSARGQRVYSRRDVENLLRVRELLYTQGFTIAGARKQLVRAPGAAPDGGEAADATKDAKAAAADGADGAGSDEVGGHGAGRGPVDPPAPKPSPNDGHDDDLRGTLESLRDEVATFLEELGG